MATKLKIEKGGMKFKNEGGHQRIIPPKFG
jgi:hypothetical protein